VTERGGTNNSIGGGEFHGRLTQAHTVTEYHSHYYSPPRPPADEAPAALHPWVEAVEMSKLWASLPEGREPGPMTAAARAIVAELAVLHDEDEHEFADDPWWDRDFAHRFLRQIGRLTSREKGLGWDFDPVEVMLLTLTPFLSQTLWVRMAAERAHVRPTELRDSGPQGERAAFLKFADDRHDRLVRRATARLPNRPGAESDIGWWLFHQWLDHDRRAGKDRRQAYEALAARLPLDDPHSGDHVRDVFDWENAGHLLHVVRLPLAETCRPENLKLVDGSFNVGGTGPFEPQKLRLQRLALLLIVARACALDLPALPDDLVENLGIPERVDLTGFRDTTLRRATWNDEHGTMVLDAADCRHVAALESLREHVARVDELLHDIHGVARASEELKPLRALPQRASAERVKARKVDDESYGKFHVDPRRVQNLLIGDTLYRRPGLAIRELYQNALDACRYRRARNAYRAQHGEDADDWTGRITFEQVTTTGRPYLECRDNGIGMGESELLRVFARAGTRFTDLTDVRNELSDWEAANISMYPVSRFGIGVLSYFMIADEIEVTTRKLLENGDPGPCYKAAIYGPHQLFRITKCTDLKEPGTKVRLYLREEAPSCVEELTRLLGLAEFETTAEHGVLWERWPAGEFRPRRQPSSPETESLNAHGVLVPGPVQENDDAPAVIWCESGGAVLVDGILTTPTQEAGVIAGLNDSSIRFGWLPSRPRSGMYGAVVNLTGKRVPKLSVDRLQILSDVSEDVEELLRGAAETLVASRSELFDTKWISSVASTHLKIADIIVESVMAADLELRLPGGRTFRPAEIGYVPDDVEIIAWSKGQEEVDELPDHVLLWRLLAHGEAGPLMELVPELREVSRVLAARPSDCLLWDTGGEEQVRPGQILAAATMTGRPAREVAARARELGMGGPEPGHYPEGAPDSIDRKLLSRNLDGSPPWLATRDAVTRRHLLRAHVRLGVGIGAVAARMATYGFDVSRAGELPDRPSGVVLRLLLGDGDGGTWLDDGTEVPPGHVLYVAERTGLPVVDVCRELRAYGLTVIDPPGRRGELDLRLLSRQCDGRPQWRGIGEEVAFGDVRFAARTCGTTTELVISTLTAYGLRPQTPRLTELTATDRTLLGLGPHESLEHGWAPPISRSRSFADIWETVRNRELSPAAVMDRLRELGVDCPLVFPEHPTADDSALLDPELALWAGRYTGETDVGVADLLVVARRVGRTVSEVAAHLTSYGFRVARHETVAPDGLQDALILLSGGLDGAGSWLDRDDPVPLGHLCGASAALGITIPEAAARLRGLGYDVPDVTETIHAALARLPRPSPPPDR
jgi:hypothetical protein